jgi:ADP-ribose pyrophosphatase YjhB (NUDIX family)
VARACVVAISASVNGADTTLCLYARGFKPNDETLPRLILPTNAPGTCGLCSPSSKPPGRRYTRPESSQSVGPLTDKEFQLLYSKVPRLAVDIVIRNQSGAVYLTKRAHEPCRGLWHIPGGTVWFGELLQHAVRRVAERELSIDVIESNQCGVIEYPSHFEHGPDSPVGLVFEVIRYGGTPRVSAEASEGGWFTRLPEPMHADQDAFLLGHGYVTQ